MLTLEKLQTKNWYLTLTEKTTISPAYYLFSFTHRLTNKTTNVILTDISSYPDRYNKFLVTEGTSFTLDEGELMYRVYAQTSDSNTNPDLADELVEQGLLKTYAATSNPTEYQPTLIEKIYEI
jgi:hypothetical protein